MVKMQAPYWCLIVEYVGDNGSDLDLDDYDTEELARDAWRDYQVPDGNCVIRACILPPGAKVGDPLTIKLPLPEAA